MKVNNDFQTQRYNRVQEHLDECKMVLTAPSSFMAYGFEEKLTEYKITADTLVNLADDKIKKDISEFKNSLLSLVEVDPKKLAATAAIISDVFGTYHTHVERKTYLVDQSDIEALRFPVIRTYTNLFKIKSTLVGEDAISDFGQCLDFADIKENINKSEWMESISSIFFSNDGVLQFNRIASLLDAIDRGLVTQAQGSTKLITGFLNIVQKGGEIPEHFRLNLDNNSIMFLAVKLSSDVMNEVRKVWYQTNLDSKLIDLVNDTTMALQDPGNLFTPSSDIKDRAIDLLLRNISQNEVFEAISEIQNHALSIVNRVGVNIELLRGVTDVLLKVPTGMSETKYCYQVIEVAKLLTLYSEQLHVIMVFINRIVHGMVSSIRSIQSLATTLANHRQVSMLYINKRKTLK